MSLDKKTVADRYAKALFELVDADNELDQTYQELIALRQVFEDNEGLDAALAGVQLSLDEKKSLIKDLQQGASKYVANLIQMVFDYGRIDCMVAIIDEFERRYDRNEVTLTKHVDPEILGGVIVHVDNKTLDGSLSSKIKQIRRLLVR